MLPAAHLATFGNVQGEGYGRIGHGRPCPRREDFVMNAPVFPRNVFESAHLRAAMPEEPVVPLTVEAYHALLKAGFFLDGHPYELLEGFVVPKMTKGPKHENARRKLRRLLEELVSDEYFVDEQGAVTTSDSEPEPDVFVVRGQIDDFPDRHAGPDEVALVAEIADSSLTRDRNWKLRVYARAKMPVYWLVNVSQQTVEVFTQPTGPVARPEFSDRATYGANDQVPVVIDGEEIGRIAVTAILGAGPPGK
jgi:Uma2 family endonuclease